MRKEVRQILNLSLSLSVFFLVVPKSEAQSDALPSPPEIKVASEAGSYRCEECHETIKESKIYIYHSNCESCHGGGGMHASAPAKGNIGFPQSGECLTCHKNNSKRMDWEFSSHNKAHLSCTDCHEIHVSNAELKSVGTKKMDMNSAKCIRCHQEIAARLNMASHHPVKEGGVSCTNCHDPHGSGSQTSLLGKNDQCFKCHQAVRGPNVFEHPPVVEDCAICHNPHGSPNRNLLEAAQPILCLRCHSLADNRHAEGAATGGRVSGAVLRRCTNCHGSLHGSHQDPHLRF